MILYTTYVSAHDLITLELRTARSSEQLSAAMAKVFNSLPNPPAGIFNQLSSAPVFHWEIVSEGQTVYFFLTLPREYHDYLVSQLTAAYPEVLIQELQHDPLEVFSPTHVQAQNNITQIKELRLAKQSAFPLMTYEDIPESTGDPLSPLLSAFSRLQENESALIQISVCKARDNWKHSAQNYSKPEGQTTPSVHETFRSLIQKKIAQPGFQTSIHLISSAPTKERQQQIENGLIQALNIVQSPINTLSTRRLWIGKNRRLAKILAHEIFPIRQYFSTTELATLYHLPNKALSSIKNIAWGKSLQGEPPADLPIYANVPEEMREELNLFGKVEFKNKEHIFGLQREDRRRHMYVMGKTGTGKSTLLANMIINDLKHDEGLAVVDPHGDLIETVLNYIPKRRINDCIILDPADAEAVVQLNLFEGGSVVHRELIASGLVSMFQKLYGHSWGPRLEYILRNTILTLLSQQAKLDDILRLLTDPRYRERVVESLDDPILKSFWLYEFDKMHERQRTEAVAPILNKVGQFVTSPLIRRVVNAKKSTIDIEEIMNEGKILLVNVSQGKLGEDNSALLGAMIITQLQLAAMNRVYLPEEQRKDFFLYIDEFQNFATTAFTKILSEARKYHLNLILANQYIAQVPEEVRSAIFGNAGNLMSFIVGADDATLLQKEFGNLYSQEDLVSLSRYQIICKLMINNAVSRPFPASTLPLAASNNQNRDKVIRVSRERYAKKE